MPDNPIKIIPEMVLEAYMNGYFPMARSKHAKTIEWILPHERGILPIEDFHLSKSTKKFIRKNTLTLGINNNFDTVIEECAKTHKGRDETWINDEIISLYKELHRMGYAHSVEVYTRKDHELIGGLYGLSLGSAFFGESMFSRVSNASKLALTGLVAHLWHKEYSLLDIQFPNDHFDQFGYRVISNDAYQELLEEALKNPRQFYDSGTVSETASGASSMTSTPSSLPSALDETVSAFLQSMTQTS